MATARPPRPRRKNPLERAATVIKDDAFFHDEDDESSNRTVFAPSTAIEKLEPNQLLGSSTGLLSRRKSVERDLSSQVVDSMSYSSSDEEVLVAECTICYRPYDEETPDRVPRNLACGHAFCTDCLHKLCKFSVPIPKINCPICHNSTSLQEDSINALPRNYPLMQVMRDSQNTARKISQLKSRERKTTIAEPPKCPEHNDYLRSYCLKDGKLICSSCELYGAHRGHPTEFLGEAALEQRKKLGALNLEVMKQTRKMSQALTRVEGTCRAVQEHGGEMEDEIDNYFQVLVNLVEEKKHSVKNEVRQRTQMRVKSLMEQAHDLKDSVEQANAIFEKTKNLLSSNDYAVLSEAMLTLERIEGVFTNPPTTTPRARNDLKCTFSTVVEEDMCSCLAGAAIVAPEVVTIDSSKISVKAYHDGFRVFWEEQKFVDNTAITYHLQMSKENADYINIFRGSATKYTYKFDLEDHVVYRFRVQVRTTEGVGNWSQPKEARKAQPPLRWHSQWRNVKVELSSNRLEAACIGSSHWTTFAADKLFERGKQYYCEIEVLSLGKQKPKIAIGLIGCGKSNPNGIVWQNRRPIGEWKEPTWTFQPISGLLKSHTVSDGGVAYGQDLKIQVGDRIGILVDTNEGKITYFCNSTDLGVAFDELSDQFYLLAVSLRDKVKIQLRFPPPPYLNRKPKLIKMTSNNTFSQW